MAAFKHPQEFVKMQFEPGEWDPHHKDPLFRPPFKSRAKIMSAEDFADRPRVGFEEEFDSLEDAMVTLTWLDGPTCDKIYGVYLDYMSKQTSVTSHEYVMRMLGEKFNITSQRAASIVELAHREDQLRKAGKKIYYGAQAFVDARVKEHITKAYSEYGETDPDSFVEDPIGVVGIGTIEHTEATTVVVDDVVDVDGFAQATLIREQSEARLKIDGHIYIEDVDENKFNIKISKEAKKLMAKKQSFHNADDISRRGDELKPMPGSDQTRRARWKYAAQTLNTRDTDAIKKSNWRKKHAIADNIIVEHDGDIRVATVAEVKQTSWKPLCNPQEKTLSSVKAGWLARTLHGDKGAWGRQKAPDDADGVIAAASTENEVEDKPGDAGSVADNELIEDDDDDDDDDEDEEEEDYHNDDDEIDVDDDDDDDFKK